MVLHGVSLKAVKADKLKIITNYAFILETKAA